MPRLNELVGRQITLNRHSKGSCELSAIGELIDENSAYWINNAHAVISYEGRYPLNLSKTKFPLIKGDIITGMGKSYKF